MTFVVIFTTVLAPLPALAAASEMVTQSTTVSLGPTSQPEAQPMAAPHGSVFGGDVDLEPFRLIGFTWTGPREGSHDDQQGQIRTRGLDGVWSDWSVMSADDHGDNTEGPSASDPIWVGSADGYEVLVPKGTMDLRVHVVREGPTTFSLSTSSATAGADGGSGSVRIRANWGARLPKEPNAVADNVRVAVVHHTGIVSHNTYRPADVPDLLRSVQAFHMDVRGWNDIGYNFVVDRFGRVWEARAGGIDRAVVGSHALGFNTGSTGIVLIGELNQVSPTQPALDALSEFLGWKLFIHGAHPTSEVLLTSHGSPTIAAGERRVMPRIIGHRDVGSTSCPGNLAYATLDSIRARAAESYASYEGGIGFQTTSVQGSASSRPLVGDFDGDGNDDVFWYAPGDAADHVWYGGDDGRFAETSATVRSVYEPFAGDFDGDGKSDIFWYTPGQTAAAISYGLASRSPKFQTRDVQVTAPGVPLTGDFDGDGDTDIFWYGAGSAADQLWEGRSGRRFAVESTAVHGVYRPFTGDFDGDGVDDLYWYAPGDGIDTVWYGSPSGDFTARRKDIVGTYEPVVGDLDGDDDDDILLHQAGMTRTSVLTGSPSRDFGAGAYDTEAGSFPYVGDITGGGTAEVLWSDRAGKTEIWRRTSAGSYERTARQSPPGPPLLLDVNGDGRIDVLWASPTGPSHELWLVGQ